MLSASTRRPQPSSRTLSAVSGRFKETTRAEAQASARPLNFLSRWPSSSGGGLQNRRGGCDSRTGFHFATRTPVPARTFTGLAAAVQLRLRVAHGVASIAVMQRTFNPQNRARYPGGSPAFARSFGSASPSLPRGVTAAHRVLTPAVRVQLQARQPFRSQPRTNTGGSVKA